MYSKNTYTENSKKNYGPGEIQRSSGEIWIRFTTAKRTSSCGFHIGWENWVRHTKEQWLKVVRDVKGCS